MVFKEVVGGFYLICVEVSTKINIYIYIYSLIYILLNCIYHNNHIIIIYLYTVKNSNTVPLGGRGKQNDKVLRGTLYSRGRYWGFTGHRKNWGNNGDTVFGTTRFSGGHGIRGFYCIYKVFC